MNRLLAVFSLTLLLYSPQLMAQESVTKPEADAIYVGEQICQNCHSDKQRSFSTSRHGKIFNLNPQNSRQKKTCEACHGPGSKHIQAIGTLDKKGSLFINNLNTENAAKTNVVCLSCHENKERRHWQSSAHAMQGLSCTSCHKLHTSGPTTSAEICGSCHKRQQAKMQRSAHHPQRNGKVTCISCHNPHGGIGPNSLKVATINETCYQCHAEKRGPNIFEHAPVRENCASCHDVHGSNHAKLLKMKSPQLCQQCHSFSRHPGDIYDGSKLGSGTAGSAAQQMAGKGCVSCHSRIHGSNHPSGVMFLR